MTIDELKARKQELMARKKYELELQERGEGDNMALFMVNEELLDVNAQLRALAPAGKRPKFGRRGRTVHASYGDRGGPLVSDRQQFIDWARQDSDEDAAESRIALRKMLRSELESVTGRQRQVLLMYAEGLRVTDIARQLRIDKSTASRTLQRAKKNIAHIMETRTALDKLRDENRLDMADPKAVQLLMGVLTAHQAVCFYLYYSEWLSIRQIGELLYVDHSTICRTIQRAVARINDILGGGIGILDNIEGVDDVVFSIYRGLSAECDELPPVVRGHFSAEPSADYVAKTRRAWGTVAPAITPRFQICGNPGARHGQLDPDQHGYLFQALQKRYEGIRLKHHGHENNWAHPIARWLVKVFQTMTKPFTYWSEKGG